EAPADEPPVRDHGSLPMDEWLDVTKARLDRVDRQLHALLKEQAPPAREVRSRNGYLTLRLRGGGLDAITGNANALKLSHPDRLRQEVLDVFRTAGLTATR